MRRAFLRIGHRGCGEDYGENTILSFELAVRAGANGIEYDVRETKDGQIVVIHDDTIDRTTNGKGKVSDHTYEELLQFNAGYRERISLFEDVLLKFRDRIFQNIELKEKGIAQKVLGILQKNLGDNNGILISSFFWSELTPISSANMPTALLADEATIRALSEYGFIARALRYGANAVNPSFEATTPALVAHAHGHNISVYPWTVNKKTDIALMKFMGVDGIISDYPERL